MEAAYKLQRIEQDNVKNWHESVKCYNELQTNFFSLIQSISEELNQNTEQFIDVHAILSDKNCSTEILLKHAKVADDELLQMIYHHPNCPISILEELINKPVGSLSFEMIELLLNNETIRQKNQRIYEHLDMVDVNLLPRKLRLEIASSPFTSEKTQLQIIKSDLISLKLLLAKNPIISEQVQLKLAQDKDDNVRECLAQNPSLIEQIQLKIFEDKDANYFRENPFTNEQIKLKIALAANPAISEQIQLKIADTSPYWEKKYLAKNPSLIEQIQLRFSEDNNMREYLAETLV